MSLRADIERLLRQGREQATRRESAPGRTADAVRRIYGRGVDNLTRSLERAHEAGAKDGMRQARLDVLGRHIAVPGGEDFAESRAYGLLTGMAAEQRRVLALADAYARRAGLAPARRLDVLRAVGGLNRVQAAALLRRHATMLEAGLPARAQRRALTEQGNRYRRQRAAMIAETETAVAGNVGREAAWTAGRALGLISARARRVWRTALDERTCPTCSALDGVSIPLDGSWDAAGVAVATPGAVHPHCRCTETLEDGAAFKQAA